jgi:hypothetical protein
MWIVLTLTPFPRFALSLPFKHFSTLSEENARFWVLRVSDLSNGNLKSSFSGIKSVKSDQLITFKGATSEPSQEEQSAMCDVLADQITATLQSENYTVTAVNCTEFEFIPYETSRKRMRLFLIGWNPRRRLQQQGGDLNIYYNVEAEYPIRSGQLDFMADGFDDIVEVNHLYLMHCSLPTIPLTMFANPHHRIPLIVEK